MKEVIMQVASYSSDYPKAPIYVADLVRCKECKNCRVEGNTTRFYWCHYWNKPTDLERYCSDGERSDT